MLLIKFGIIKCIQRTEQPALKMIFERHIIDLLNSSMVFTDHLHGFPCALDALNELLRSSRTVVTYQVYI